MLSLLLLFSLFFLVGFPLISYLQIGCWKRFQIWNLPNLIISGWVKFVSVENFSVLMKIFVCYLQWLQHYWTERMMYPKGMFLPTEWILKQVHQLLQNGGVQSMGLSEVVSLVLNSTMETAASMKMLLTEQQTRPHWMHVLHSVNRIKKACTNLFRSKTWHSTAQMAYPCLRIALCYDARLLTSLPTPSWCRTRLQQGRGVWESVTALGNWEELISKDRRQFLVMMVRVMEMKNRRTKKAVLTRAQILRICRLVQKIKYAGRNRK